MNRLNFTKEIEKTLKRAIVCVTTDLVTDQRVAKVSQSLKQMGFEVLLVGRQRRKSLPMDVRLYRTKRMHLFFEKGPLFYAEYNFRLFIFLLFKKTHIIVSNDLDTLMPCFLVSRIKSLDLVYDSHEYFTGVPEIQNRPFVKKVWEGLEKWILPRLKTIFTVNESIANLYREKYQKEVHVFRNIPQTPVFAMKQDRLSLGLPDGKHIVLLQGSGINIDRGAEELVEAFKPEYRIEGAILVIAGDGDVVASLKQIVEHQKMEDRVLFFPRMPYLKLLQYTRHASIGTTLDKDTNINYRYSLPNKIFDYIHCGVPVLASDLPEIRKIIEQYQVGIIVKNHLPETIAGAIIDLLADQERLTRIKANTKEAALDLNWENESEVIRKVYSRFL